jgi:hypothetical protein
MAMILHATTTIGALGPFPKQSTPSLERFIVLSNYQLFFWLGLVATAHLRGDGRACGGRNGPGFEAKQR